MLTSTVPSTRLWSINLSEKIKLIDIKRRDLLIGLCVAGAGVAPSPVLTDAKNQNQLKILVLGGTGFIGPHIVREALARGQVLTRKKKPGCLTHGISTNVQSLSGGLLITFHFFTGCAPVGEPVC